MGTSRSCSTVPQTDCKQVPTQKCSTVYGANGPEENCQTDYEQKCTTVQKEQCKDIPSQQCKDVPLPGLQTSGPAGVQRHSPAGVRERPQDRSDPGHRDHVRPVQLEDRLQPGVPRLLPGHVRQPGGLPPGAQAELQQRPAPVLPPGPQAELLRCATAEMLLHPQGILQDHHRAEVHDDEQT